MFEGKRRWRSHSASAVHPTLEGAKTSLIARTKRHRSILEHQVHRVEARLRELGVEPKPVPTRFANLIGRT